MDIIIMDFARVFDKVSRPERKSGKWNSSQRTVVSFALEETSLPLIITTNFMTTYFN